MRRPTPQQIDEAILDVAAGVFAQYGYEQASVQRIADEAGYSKTGLLHRFASKDAIKEAVRGQCLELGATMLAAVRQAPAGPQRDRATVATLVDLAMSHPGTVALLLSAGTQEGATDASWILDDARRMLDEAFEIDDDTELGRRVRVVGCLGALGFGVVVLREYPAHLVRDALVDTCCAALGT